MRKLIWFDALMLDIAWLFCWRFFFMKMLLSHRIFPCIFTLCNAFFGLFAILLMIVGYAEHNFVLYHCATYSILLAAMLDWLDGYVARKWNGQSILGFQLDSMSDLLSFGIAPFLMIVFALDRYVVEESLRWFVWLVAFIFPFSTMLRLAYFNVSKSSDEDINDFVGMPAPIAGGTLMLWLNFNGFPDLWTLFVSRSTMYATFPWIQWFGNIQISWNFMLLIGIVVVYGYLMQVNVKFRKLTPRFFVFSSSQRMNFVTILAWLFAIMFTKFVLGGYSIWYTLSNMYHGMCSGKGRCASGGTQSR